MDYPQQNVYTKSKQKTNSLLRNIYLWMSLALVLTATVSYSVANNTQLLKFFFSNSVVLILLIIAQFACVIFLSARLQHMSLTACIATFALYSVLTGVTLSSIFIVYTRSNITNAFFSAALMFGGMSLYAMTTKRDLSSWRSYLVMGLWGIIIASVLNIFLRSSAFYYMISYFGVILFLGLTAYDTQKLLRIGNNIDGIGEENYIKLSIYGALTLYLDFINLFLFLLRIFGRGSNN